MPPSPPRSSGEAAYDALLKALREGDYRPGDRLREEEVAERLSISRTPVREALRKLESEGVVEHRPRVGAVIRGLSHTEIVELFEMRTVLERTAAELAAKHGTDAEFDTLDALNRDIDATRDDPARAAGINQAFHVCLHRASRNRFLEQAARALTQSLLLLGPTTFTEDARIDTVTAEHQAIIDALRAGNATAAGEAAAAHLQTSLRHRLRTLGR